MSKGYKRRCLGILCIKMNVQDKYREWLPELIKKDIQANTFPYAVLMQHWQGDFNIATLIRNANAFGAREVFYVGRKHIDKRGTVGTHHYTDVNFLKTNEEVLALKDKYTFVALENNHERSQSIVNFVWPENPLLIFGEETSGVTADLLEQCHSIVHIPQFGSVRSINVGTASGIAMHNLVTHLASIRAQ